MSIDLWHVKTATEHGFPYLATNIGCSVPTLTDYHLHLNMTDGDFHGWKSVVLDLFTVGGMYRLFSTYYEL